MNTAHDLTSKHLDWPARDEHPCLFCCTTSDKEKKFRSDEDQNSGRADAEHDVDVLRVLGVMQADAVHGQLLRVLKVVQL